MVPHREDRVLTVRIGEVEVKDLGTRFFVSCENNLTLVAVEEGEVEVKTPKGTQVLHAGRAITWSDGQLSEQHWEPKTTRPLELKAIPETNSIARLGDEDDEPIDAAEWESLPKKHPPAPRPQREPFSLRHIERKLRELGTKITTPLPREAEVRNIALSSDADDCVHALKLADAWLSAPVSTNAKEPLLRRVVFIQQMRCLNHLGRKEEAAQIQRTLDNRP